MRHACALHKACAWAVYTCVCACARPPSLRGCITRGLSPFPVPHHILTCYRSDYRCCRIFRSGGTGGHEHGRCGLQGGKEGWWEGGGYLTERRVPHSFTGVQGHTLKDALERQYDGEWRRSHPLANSEYVSGSHGSHITPVHVKPILHHAPMHEACCNGMGRAVGVARF